MQKFDYDSSAELFTNRRYAKSLQARFQRFDRAADAVRYVVEEMPAAWLNGTVLEVDERRFEGTAIRGLYEAGDYPLPRVQAAA